MELNYRVFVPLIDSENKTGGYVEAYGYNTESVSPKAYGYRTESVSPKDSIGLFELASTRMVSELNLRRLHAELEKQASTDSLTGLSNRRYMMERMETEIAYAKRYKKYLGVLMVDIDNFKIFNDTYGHPE